MNIYVGNLAYEVTEEDLKTEFEAFGEVASVAIIKDNYTGRSKGFGFVEMPKLQEGQAAITGLNGKKLKERTITVNGAQPKGESGPAVAAVVAGRPLVVAVVVADVVVAAAVVAVAVAEWEDIN